MHRHAAILWLKSLLKANRPRFRTFNFIAESNFACLCNLTHLFVNYYIFMLEDKVRPFYHFISCSKIAQGCYEKGTSFLFFHKTHNLSLVIKKKNQTKHQTTHTRDTLQNTCLVLFKLSRS